MILKRMICWNRNTARSLRGAHPRFNRWFELTSLILALVVAMLLSYYGTGAAMAHASSSRRATHASLVTSHPPKGTVVDVPDCLQPPPQSAKDRATYTPAELAEYGLPTRDESEPFAKWAQVVRGARKRACQYTVGTQPLIVTPDVSEHNNQHWAGNYADEDTPGQTYTEADTDYYAICPSQSPPENASYNAWVGIGGVIVASNYDLVQTGTQVIQQYQPGGYYASYVRAWTENLYGDPPPSGTSPEYWFDPNCGDHMYAKAADIGSHGCMFVEDLSTGEYSGQQCYGPRSDEQSAEDIVEHQTTVEPDLANFGTVTFYGVGITDNGGYYAMSQLPHDYANMYACAAVKGQTCYQWGDWLARTTPIVNDPGDTPYDEYGVAFVNYS